MLFLFSTPGSLRERHLIKNKTTHTLKNVCVVLLGLAFKGGRSFLVDAFKPAKLFACALQLQSFRVASAFGGLTPAFLHMCEMTAR